MRNRAVVMWTSIAFNFSRFTSSFNIRMMSSSFPRILSVQSHIVHGYVGNKAATFPLQSLGYNVDAINTVHLSNHPAYPKGFKGQTLNGDDFSLLVDGLAANDLLRYELVVSGYISAKEILIKIPGVISAVKARNPDALYICDPVLGDRGQFYVPKALLDIYMNEVIPICDIITPNIFEAETITRLTIDSLSSALQACHKFHELGVKVCLLKGVPLSGPAGPLSMVLSTKGGMVYRIDVPRIDGHFSGCGDLCTAMFAGWYYRHPHNMGLVLDNVASIMSTVLSSSARCGSKELMIVENMNAYHTPPPPPSPSYRVQGPLTGVIFDMDGTLTEAGAIDFEALYRRTGLQRGKDILSQIALLPLEQQGEANRIVVEEEMLGCERMRIRKDTTGVLTALHKMGVRTAVATRNCVPAYERFAARLDTIDASGTGTMSCQSTFSVVVTRETLNGVNKPDPRVASHILDQWGVEAGSVWFVGDHADDMTCGKLAGCRTCFLVTPETTGLEPPPNADLVVHSLSAFLSAVSSESV
eukprot:gene7549-15468_t